MATMHINQFHVRNLFMCMVAMVVAVLTLTQAKSVKLQKIIGGEPAKDGEFPFMVILKVNEDLHCGGSLIARRTILTAAHCIQNVDIDNFTVTAGTNSVSTGGKTYKVEDLLVHPDYDDTLVGFPNDLGLIHTIEKIQLGDLVQPVLLPSVNSWSGEGDQVIAMGWGLIDMINAPDVLMTNNLTVYSNENCTNKHHVEIKDSQICAGGSKGNGVCTFDSGSPLVDLNGTQVGIVSWGRPCATGIPDVFTKVSTFIDWIQDNLK